MAGVLDEHAPKGFRWRFRLMEEESHNSVPLRSTRQGLEAVFEGWHLHDVLTVYDRGGLGAVDAYYRAGRRRLSYEPATPASTVLLLAGQLRAAGRLDEVGAVLKSASSPSSFSHRLLAEAYAARGNDERAREHYTLALEANPGAELAKRKLTEMGVDVTPLVSEATVAAETLASYAGRYDMPPYGWVASSIYTVRYEDGQLTVHAEGLLPFVLVPVSQTEFATREIDTRFRFNIGATGEVVSITREDVGLVGKAMRID